MDNLVVVRTTPDEKGNNGEVSFLSYEGVRAGENLGYDADKKKLEGKLRGLENDFASGTEQVEMTNGKIFQLKDDYCLGGRRYLIYELIPAPKGHHG